MKLQLGKKYRTRNGLMTGPLIKSGNGTNYTFAAFIYEPEFENESFLCWTENGEYIAPGEENRLDLIGEWGESN